MVPCRTRPPRRLARSSPAWAFLRSSRCCWDCNWSHAMEHMAAPPLPSASSLRHFHVLAKPTGAICNLDCKYCFFLSKEMLYPGDRFRMADDLLDTYVRQLLESQPGPDVSIAWQGGEPTLMGLPFFRRAMAVVEKYRRPGMSIDHT